MIYKNIYYCNMLNSTIDTSCSQSFGATIVMDFPFETTKVRLIGGNGSPSSYCTRLARTLGFSMIEHVIDMMTWVFSFQVSNCIRWWPLGFLMIEHVIDMMTWIFASQTWETNHKTFKQITKQTFTLNFATTFLICIIIIFEDKWHV